MSTESICRSRVLIADDDEINLLLLRLHHGDTAH